MQFVLWVGLMAVVGVVRLCQTPAWLCAKARGKSFQWFTPGVQ